MVRAIILRNDYVLKRKPYNFTADDGGLYAITPYSVDNKGYGLFKCGYAKSFLKRLESYHTSLAPSGLWLVCFMRVKYPKNEDRDSYLRRLEKLLFSMFSLNKDCIIHKPLTRVSVSEWVYTSINTLHSIFDKLAEEYVDKNIKSNKLILNRLTLRDCKKWNEEQENKKGKHLNTHIVVHIEPFKEQNKELEQVIKFIRKKEKEKKEYNLRSKSKKLKRTETSYGLRNKNKVDYKSLSEGRTN